MSHFYKNKEKIKKQQKEYRKANPKKHKKKTEDIMKKTKVLK